MSGPFALLVVLHGLSALIGFGALGASGAYAAAVKRSPDPARSPSLRAYFRPSHNLAGAAIFLVPVFGAGLVALRPAAAHRVYPWVGLGLWVVAAAAAAALCWPAEARLQRLLAAGTPPGRPELARACRRLELGSVLVTLCALAALVDMVGAW